MAQDSDLSKTADKGKGKAVDAERKPEDLKKGDGQPAATGKKDDDKDECLSCPRFISARL